MARFLTVTLVGAGLAALPALLSHGLAGGLGAIAAGVALATVLGGRPSAASVAGDEQGTVAAGASSSDRTGSTPASVAGSELPHAVSSERSKSGARISVSLHGLDHRIDSLPEQRDIGDECDPNGEGELRAGGYQRLRRLPVIGTGTPTSALSARSGRSSQRKPTRRTPYTLRDTSRSRPPVFSVQCWNTAALSTKNARPPATGNARPLAPTTIDRPRNAPRPPTGANARACG